MGRRKYVNAYLQGPRDEGWTPLVETSSCVNSLPPPNPLHWRLTLLKACTVLLAEVEVIFGDLAERHDWDYKVL